MADTLADQVKADEQKRADLAAKLAEHNAEVSKHDTALAPLTTKDGAAKSGMEAAVSTITSLRDAAQTSADNVTAQIDAIDKRLATARYRVPLIEKIGVVKVEDSSALPGSIKIEEVEERRNKALSVIKGEQSKIAVFDAILGALDAVELPDDAIDSMPPIHLKANGEKQIVPEFASGRGGGGGGGTRAGLVRITATADNFKALNGKTVGTGGDFKSWREVVQKSVSPDTWKELDGVTSTGKPKSWSAHEYAKGKMGITTVTVAEASAPSTEPEPAAAG
ncbi:MAG: hypothetical protein M0Q49_05640 [Porticoccaceae bacterium]|nr:hypothetical protein [Porticoccaceae bacterium]